MKVLHRCDTPACVRPAHLFLGSQAENVADMMAKGRWNRLRGEQNPSARLTADEVIAIRCLEADGSMTQAALARRYKVHPMTIRAILWNWTWRHVE
jgi:hypothetical protein